MFCSNVGLTTKKKTLCSSIFILRYVLWLMFVYLIPLMLFVHTAGASSALSSEEAMICMGCHSSPGMVKTFKNKEKLSVSLSEKHFKDTVHSFLTCTGCHTDVSMETHPSKQYESKREFVIHVSMSCMTCHPKDNAKFEEGIHYSALKEGNPKAPVCSDCHGAHNVSKKALLQTIETMPCKRCHENSFKGYVVSVHGIAMADGKKDSALCTSCHFAHEVKPAVSSSFSKAKCLQCHKKSLETHNEWLSNAELHLSAISCITCHVPDAEMRVYIHVIDRNTGEIVSEPKVKEVLGTELVLSEEGINAQQLWNLYQKLRGVNSRLKGTVGIDSMQSHRLSKKDNALRECERCHNAKLQPFRDVKIALIRQNGKEDFYKVDPKVLSSIMSILPLNEFYVLGSMRITLLDILGILMVAGGASFPAMHIILRILTRKLRAEKKHEGRQR